MTEIEWIKENEKFITSQETKDRMEILIKPETQELNLQRFVSPIKDSMVNWIRRKTDTSIRMDEKNQFRSSGMILAKEMEAIANLETHDIFVRENGELKYFEYSHHNKEVISWIHPRNSIKSLGVYRSHILNVEDNIPVFEEEAFILNTRWSGTNFYHWFHEAVPRLEYLRKFNDFPGNYKMIWGGKGKPKSYHIKSLEQLGVKVEDLYYMEGLVKFKRLNISSILHGGSMHKMQMNSLRDHMNKILGNRVIDQRQFEKIAILRKQDQARTISNKNEILNLLDSKGYKVVFLEDHDLSDQIAIVKSARSVIGVHGSGLTHVANMMEDAHVIELMPMSSIHPLYCYMTLLNGSYYTMVPCVDKGNRQELICEREIIDYYIQ